MTSARGTCAGVVAMFLIVAAAMLGGCSSYTLQGKVVLGEVSYVSVVDENDPRFEGPGVPGVQVELWTDPDRLGRKHVGSAVSDGDGRFSIAVDEFGAGVLEYDVGLFAQREGFVRAQQSFRLPPKRQRVIVVLRRGADTPGAEREDLMEEFRRYNR